MTYVTALGSFDSLSLSLLLLLLFLKLLSLSYLFCCVDYKTLHGVRSGMAMYRLTPPATFPFRSPDEWPQWL